jgi:hypothetical protein
MSTLVAENIAAPVATLAQLASETGLIVRPFNAEIIGNLFAELENFDAEERCETFAYLKQALNETRASLGAELVYHE